MTKVYLAVAHGTPTTPEWTSRLALPPHPDAPGRMIVGYGLYGPAEPGRYVDPNLAYPQGLRAVELAYADPFARRPVRIRADTAAFQSQFGFGDNAPAA